MQHSRQQAEKVSKCQTHWEPNWRRSTTKIFEALRKGPRQLALDYMAAALDKHRRNAMAPKRAPQKKKK